MELTRAFKNLSKDDAGIAGGKGASLGEMTQAGIPVPPGFVVLSGAFEQFIKETGLIQEIDAVLSKVNHKEIHTVESASEKIRELILNADMPDDIATEISHSFKELDTKYVAVRSSATAEDGKDHAWAGQLESYLNTKEDDILTKVKLCWSSLFTPRAIFYRFEKGLHTTKISVAVVIQKMVESEVSGIAFSVHPVTEDPNQLIIEAGFGLGEAIVSGSVTPDSYVVEKEPRNILDINVSTQNRALYRSDIASVDHGNNDWVNIPEPKASSQVLLKDQILELSKIIIGIENHYGFPCDIEWAFEGGKFYIVQSRPITTLSNTGGIVSDSSTKSDVVASARKINWVHWVDRPLGPFILTLNMSVAGHDYYENLGLHDPDFGYETSLYQYPIFYYSKELEERNTKALERYLDKRTVFDLSDLLENTHEKNVKAIKGLIAKPLSPKEKLAETREILRTYSPFLWLNISLEKHYQDLIDKEFPKYVKGDIKQFVGEASIPSKKNAYNIMLDMMESGTSLEEVREQFGWMKNRDGFTDFYTIAELEEIKNNHRNEHKSEPTVPVALKGLVSELKELTFLRTSRTDKMYEIMGLVRPIFKEVASLIGVEFQELQDYDVDSLLSGENLEKIKKPYNCIFINGNQVIQYDKFVPFDSGNIKELKGNSAYRGIVRGPVTIVRHSNDLAKVNFGDVLVTQMTFPSFISAMQKAVAFVTDEGGVTCHASIIAREMKKPCVIATKIATQVLKDGDVVEVDADRGIITIIK